MQVEAIPNVGTALTLVNDGSESDQKLLAEANWGNAEWAPYFSGPRGTQGARATGATPQNRSLVLPFRVYGTSKDDLALNISALHTVIDKLRRYGGRIRVRPTNASYSVYFDVMTGSADLTEWGNRAEATNRAGFMLAAVCAPYLKQDALSVMTFSSQSLPNVFNLGTTIPGDAPALADIAITTSGGAAAPVSALIGWSERPAVHNLVWQDFATGIAGYADNPDPGYGTIAGAVLTHEPIPPATGPTGAAGRLKIETNADAEGAGFRIYRRFRAGVTYRFKFEYYNTATPGGYAEFGVPNSVDRSSVVCDVLNTWTTVTLAWTPSADRDLAIIVLRSYNATARSLYLGNVRVYEGATEPTLASQTFGKGAYPPFGLLEAEACDSGSLSTWAITADADYSAGYGLQATTSGAGTASAEYLIDPALLVRDDYTLGDVDVVVYGRVELASTVVSPKLILSARPTAGTDYGSERYSNEWQSAGKLLTLPSSGTRFRPVRLGTLPLLSDSSAPLRWRLKVAASWAAGSSGTFGLDYLWLVLARKHALSPDAKPNDSTYPDFVASTNATVKTIRSDLSGTVAQSGQNAHPDHGLGGSLLELPPGTVDVLVKLSSLVPDDPTSDATSEQLAHTGSTVALTVTPRWAYFRPS